MMPGASPAPATQWAAPGQVQQAGTAEGHGFRPPAQATYEWQYEELAGVVVGGQQENQRGEVPAPFRSSHTQEQHWGHREREAAAPSSALGRTPATPVHMGSVPLQHPHPRAPPPHGALTSGGHLLPWRDRAPVTAFDVYS
ncbi:hypothetical protein NDU88_003905 [Pleurodeles waltl]|uniref:Uncharacterized protein n=1 Tax=Pleurodeles waltl TaxID=8319 RepID=A0AAV7UZW6_PLEWA|nr:hypothetical protein NDU88_003905 [Pleurodeles waltl]